MDQLVWRLGRIQLSWSVLGLAGWFGSHLCVFSYSQRDSLACSHHRDRGTGGQTQSHRHFKPQLCHMYEIHIGHIASHQAVSRDKWKKRYCKVTWQVWMYNSVAGGGRVKHGKNLPQTHLRNSKCMHVSPNHIYVYGFSRITYKSESFGLCYHIEYADMQNFKGISKVRTFSIF